MTPRIESEVSRSVWSAIEKRRVQTGESIDHIVDALLAEALELDRHSLFQVSTSTALVQGVFGGVVTVEELRRHGDFGLGTFSGLDGELVIVDGDCFRATAGGVVEPAADDREVPFALVTWFESDVDVLIDAASFEEMTAAIDSLRSSENLFVAARVEAEFDRLSMRAACKALPGENLLEATSHQSEFDLDDVKGSLVGFWSPPYSRTIGVPGYHFHFISDDHEVGGHVLGLRAVRGRIRLHTGSDLHIALPETSEFLTADLSGDHQEELDAVETERRSPDS